ncbi:MAG TPA: FlgD immunoglobulin-like domain containing protein [Candidatus Saccharimonadaceae bacterium]|nr:FlgD immunoglobulin-like domain containing protein [Candidatus Saccharimonadaceae bacterium]
MKYSRFSFSLAAASLGLALSAAPSFAVWPHDSGANLPVCTATGDQQSVVMTPEGSGGAYVAWTDPRTGDTNIYATHLTKLGGLDPAWPLDGLGICLAVSLQTELSMTSDGSNGAFAVWMDTRSLSTEEVYVQHLIPAGADPAWPVNGRAAASFSTATELNPRAVADGSGGVIVTWTDLRPGGDFSEVYAQHVRSNGQVDPAWPAAGLLVCTAPNNQQLPVLVADGVGGAVITWQDGRAGNNDIYAQHVRADGTVDPAWPANGRALCTNVADEQPPAIISDGAGGAIVAWPDQRGGTYDIYADHVQSNGALDPTWPPDGKVACAAANDQKNPTMMADGSGGSFIAWEDGRAGAFQRSVFMTHMLSYGNFEAIWTVNGIAITSGAFDHLNPVLVGDGGTGMLVTWFDGRTVGDVYAGHVRADATLDPTWPATGKAVSTALSTQTNPLAVSDGSGGLIATWIDHRSGGSDVYAQRLARGGFLGTPEPVIESVRDIPNDQGGAVDVAFDASWLDLSNDPNLGYYEIWRGLPSGAAQMALRKGAHLQSSFAHPPTEVGAIVAPIDRADAYAWQYVGSITAAHFIPTYSFLGPTLGDSIGSANPRTGFMVIGRDNAGLLYWLSAPDSGYSVDNVPPTAPAPFLGVYGSGSSNLSWGPNTSPDFASYRLYRGKSAGFTPSGGTLVTATTLTSYTDHPGQPYYYKVSALDVHGNESAYSLVLPTGSLAVDDAQHVLALARPSPNPARAGASLRFTLPSEMSARLSIFDLSGRRVASLADGVLGAGDHELRWDLRGANGVRVADGVYFVRLEAAGRTLAERMAVTK